MSSKPLVNATNMMGSLTVNTTRLKTFLSALPKLHVENVELRFTCFNNLPPELRNKVWKKACFQARLVKLAVFPNATSSNLNLERFKGQCKIPAVLHVCAESREEGLRYYMSYALTHPSGVLEKVDVPVPQRMLFVNFEADQFLYVRPYQRRFGFPAGFGYICNFRPEDLEKIKFLIIDITMSPLSNGQEDQYGLLLSKMKSVVECKFVTNAKPADRNFNWDENAQEPPEEENLGLQLSIMDEREDWIGEEVAAYRRFDPPPAFIDSARFSYPRIAFNDEDLIPIMSGSANHSFKASPT